jgi:hypothetical protein
LIIFWAANGLQRRLFVPMARTPLLRIHAPAVLVAASGLARKKVWLV